MKKLALEVVNELDNNDTTDDVVLKSSIEDILVDQGLRIEDILKSQQYVINAIANKRSLDDIDSEVDEESEENLMQSRSDIDPAVQSLLDSLDETKQKEKSLKKKAKSDAIKESKRLAKLQQTSSLSAVQASDRSTAVIMTTSLSLETEEESEDNLETLGVASKDRTKPRGLFRSQIVSDVDVSKSKKKSNALTAARRVKSKSKSSYVIKRSSAD